MANPPPPNDGGFVEYTPQEWISSSIPRTSTEPNERMLESSDFVQGRIFWLGSKDELPERAVKRAHGKGAIDEGIYSHPVVVLARPADEAHLVHFHLVSIVFLSSTEYRLTWLRLLLYKARSLISSTTSRPNSMPVAVPGTCRYHQPQTIPTLLRRRPRNAFRRSI